MTTALQHDYNTMTETIFRVLDQIGRDPALQADDKHGSVAPLPSGPTHMKPGRATQYTAQQHRSHARLLVERS